MGYTLEGCCCDQCLPDRIVAEFFLLRHDPMYWVSFTGCTDPTGSFKLSVDGMVTSEIPIPFNIDDVQPAMESILDPADFYLFAPSTAPATVIGLVLFGDYKSSAPPTVEVVDFEMECAVWEGGNTPDDPSVRTTIRAPATKQRRQMGRMNWSACTSRPMTRSFVQCGDWATMIRHAICRRL